MSVQLARDDFNKLVAILRTSPGFATVRDRRRLVEAALEGVPRGADLLALLDLDGAPQLVAVEVVKRLAEFGQVAEGREALGVFLNALLNLMGEDKDAVFIRALFVTYPLDRPTGIHNGSAPADTASPAAPSAAPVSASSRTVRYSGKIRLAFCRRLGDDWRPFADYLEIPAFDQARFEQGDEARALWVWLENRNRLAELIGALADIGRLDLVELLKSEAATIDRSDHD